MTHNGSNVVVTVLFWVFFVLCVLGGGGYFLSAPERRYYGVWGVFILLLIGLLGWVVFRF